MEIDWKSVEKILVVRLRSIGDAVLSTPTLLALREFLPHAKIDILLEDWVAPVLDGFSAVDEVVTVSNSTLDRLRVAAKIRRNKYDIAINLHGGTTATFLTRATGASIRIGYRHYQYSFLFNKRFPTSAEYWGKEKSHSAEQQIALIGHAGVPFEECPKTKLSVTAEAAAAVEATLADLSPVPQTDRIALIHPGTAYETKRWAAKNFAIVIDNLESRGFSPVVVTTISEVKIAASIEASYGKPLRSISGLSLPEVTALASRAALFVGNDSGIAHIAAAVGTPSVVVFGSSNIDSWRPWTDAPNRIVSIQLDCQPCPGDRCRVYGKPKCIIEVSPGDVLEKVDQLLSLQAI